MRGGLNAIRGFARPDNDPSRIDNDDDGLVFVKSGMESLETRENADDIIMMLGQICI